MATILVLSTSILILSILLFVTVSLPLYCYSRCTPKDHSKLYHDKDGVTTPKAQAVFDRNRRIHVGIILLVSAVGLVSNTSSAICMKADWNDYLEHWHLHLMTLKIAAAVSLCFQGIFIAMTGSPRHRQNQGAVAGISSVLVYAVNICFDAKQMSRSKIHLAFLMVHIPLLIASITVNLSLARRPQLFDYARFDQALDGEQTVSILSRYTLSWANPLLSLAIRKGGLDIHDLPLLPACGRAKTLVERITREPEVQLWKRIIFNHWFSFASQWLLTICHSIMMFTPQYFLWRLIRAMEETSSTRPPLMAALWLALLGLAPLVQSWIETWLLWIGWCHIALPISVELSGLIVEKSLRKKDVQDVGDTDGVLDKNFSTEGNLESSNYKKWVNEGTRDRVNLISVDTQRIQEFLSYNSMVLGIGLSVLFSLSFLLSFIRLQSILTGLAGISILVPINVMASRRYRVTQNRLMHSRDLKANKITECIRGIHQIKFDALESQWSMKIHSVRSVELSQQWQAYLADTVLMMCWIAGPIMFAAITLSVISVYEHDLLPSTAFTALSVFQRLEGILSLVPETITDLYNARISFSRITTLLDSADRVDTTVDAGVITFEHADISWPSGGQQSKEPTLQSMNFYFPRNSMSIVIGPTGVGKSLLLQAIIGEADILKGAVGRPKAGDGVCSHQFDASAEDWLLPKTTAFVAQTPWIQNATIRDNIIFGLPLLESRYALVLQACDLLPDIHNMEDGDLTEVGAHGISLSGGQRIRLSLARALYCRAEILVIDDVFSAVDAHVARHLLDHALTGKLAEGRTRIIATHHVQLCLPKADFAVCLKHGTAEYAGSVDGLQQHGSIVINSTSPESEKPTASVRQDFSDRKIPPSDSSSDDPFKKTRSQRHVTVDIEPWRSSAEPKRLVQEERHETGRTNVKAYKRFLSAASTWPWMYWMIIIALLVGFEAALVGRNWWIKTWSESHMKATQRNVLAPFSTAPDRSNKFYLIGCICISILTSFLGTFKFFWVYIGSLRASKSLSDDMAHAVLHAPLRWLDTVPTGRILNRFIADFNTIDTNLANHMVLLGYFFLQLVGIIFGGGLVSPYLLLLALPLIGLCFVYAHQYLAGARDVKRLESIKRSPVLEQFEAILSGLSTIRAWNKSSIFLDRMFDKLDDHARCVWHLWLFNRWLGMRFAFIGSIFTLSVGCFSVYSPSVSAALTGLALTFSLEFTNSIFWVLRYYADVEMDMNSLERITEFCEIPQEAADGPQPPSQWPTKGEIVISNLVAGYAADLPPVLNDLSIRCEGHSHVGVVGRTGAGKSSLTLALLRFLEPRSGSIMIDNIDISTIDLLELRRRIAIIPQHPFLWHGSVRSNLDSFGIHTDAQLQKALERVQLNRQSVQVDITEGDRKDQSLHDIQPGQTFTLQTQISEGGLNISLGQRQLICLARALLSEPKLLIMDEATSAVDIDTDSLVQRSIRAELGQCTLLVIAHKLSTVIDMDKIVVLHEGRVAEMGAPKELWNKGGLFASMVRQSAEKNLLEKLI